MSLKEQYWRYSLVIIILLLGTIIFFKSLPFISGILGAMTIYILLRNQMLYLTVKKRMRPSLMAALLLVETILCFLVPLSLVVWLFVSKLQEINLDPHSMIAPAEHVADLIEQRIGYDVMSKSNVDSLLSMLPKIGQMLMGSISSFAINVVVLLFVLYFMLIGGTKMEEYVSDILPFNKRNKQSILHEFNMIVKSNAIGIPLLALIQGVVAMIGYFIFGVPSPLLWGFLSCFATVIPIVGTALVWAPLVLYMGMTGHWGAAIGLAVYAVIVIANVDNLVRFMLQKKMADTHPLITIFGVIIGLSLFGFMGVIFGPLLLAIFAFCVNIFKEEYLGEDRKYQ
ncbi:AI-2E family transporter [Butyricimonas synergistica]|uniref:AI-2E family transporter n=1 Tax=Butyricimonas synergistica TaxID=544644 RepID=UPI000379FC65|nr:AI-2E family transporter [Butyricimonas synergistica]